MEHLGRELSWQSVPVQEVGVRKEIDNNFRTTYLVKIDRKELPDGGEAVTEVKIRLWIGEDMLTTENHSFKLHKFISEDNDLNIVIPIVNDGKDLSDLPIRSAEAWIRWKLSS